RSTPSQIRERGRNHPRPAPEPTESAHSVNKLGLRQYKTIWQTAEANWTNHIQGAADILIQDNIELTHERKGYCWKEFDDIRGETLHLPCCHLQKPKYT
ncbi:hypothetical protein, partial [Phaeovulum veldkampii]|uniref:hypothetical protein n=2 Tax=Phaeovulum veldkampii TaxID=33049 RepID=UPI001B3C1018